MGESKPFLFRAEDYSKYRPQYPEKLFKFISSLANGHEKAWDCATGNGQAAIGLVPYFKEIIATDISEEQITNCIPNNKIRYFKASAENSNLPPNSIDLITVATAIHWFDKDKFFKEVKRILKPKGILAVWNYTNFTLINNEIEKVLNDFNEKILGTEYWPEPAYKIFTEGYTFKFPFENVNVPEITMEHNWSLNDIIKYLHTWSGVQIYIKKIKKDPIDLIYNDLKKLWGDSEIQRKVKWRLLFRVNRLD